MEEMIKREYANRLKTAKRRAGTGTTRQQTCSALKERKSSDELAAAAYADLGRAPPEHKIRTCDWARLDAIGVPRSLRVRVKFDLGWENGHVTRLDDDSFYVTFEHEWHQALTLALSTPETWWPDWSLELLLPPMPANPRLTLEQLAALSADVLGMANFTKNALGNALLMETILADYAAACSDRPDLKNYPVGKQALTDAMRDELEAFQAELAHEIGHERVTTQFCGIDTRVPKSFAEVAESPEVLLSMRTPIRIVNNDAKEETLLIAVPLAAVLSEATHAKLLRRVLRVEALMKRMNLGLVSRSNKAPDYPDSGQIRRCDTHTHTHTHTHTAHTHSTAHTQHKHTAQHSTSTHTLSQSHPGLHLHRYGVTVVQGHRFGVVKERKKKDFAANFAEFQHEAGLLYAQLSLLEAAVSPATTLARGPVRNMDGKTLACAFPGLEDYVRALSVTMSRGYAPCAHKDGKGRLGTHARQHTHMHAHSE